MFFWYFAATLTTCVFYFSKEALLWPLLNISLARCSKDKGMKRRRILIVIGPKPFVWNFSLWTSICINRQLIMCLNVTETCTEDAPHNIFLKGIK